MNPLLTLFWRHLKPALGNPAQMLGLAVRILSLLKNRGLYGTFRKFSHRHQLYDEYPRWVALYDTISDQELDHMRSNIARLPRTPLFSLLIPAMAGKSTRINPVEESLLNQIYPHWEIQYVAQDSDGLNIAIAAAKGEWITLLEPACLLPPHALYLIAAELVAHPDTLVTYADEDQIDVKGQRKQPIFKPDWNPDLLLSHNYLGSPVFYSALRLRKLMNFSGRIDPFASWEIALRLTDGISTRQIRHIPRILCHRLTPLPVQNPGRERQILETHLHRTNRPATVLPSQRGYWRVRHALPAPPPLVSIIIPTRNGVELLARCITSIRKKTTYTPYEIIVVDNQSDDPITLDYLHTLGQDGLTRVLAYDAPFNYSAINNHAVKHAHGDYLCLLNNDVEIIDPDWLEELVSQSAQPETGAVGAMLYYPDGSIQHAGIALAGKEQICFHLFARLPASLLETRPRALCVQNLSALTGACLVIQKRKFIEVDGFDPNLAVTYNDVDLCLRLSERGYRNIWTPYARLIHHESASRGFDDTLAGQARIVRERAYMLERWSDTLLADPAYNPNLELDGESYSLAFPPRNRFLIKQTGSDVSPTIW